ncbi:expressed unknown protein [Seminavis robusta]|uniref:Transmembrane protein n=1 Tax=Seminavis robusta TaxID=568900 RepID=A0A9N8EST8_9STRA|nr:expressed unknown protein [Seminavis robusta]|eukprot:Sro1538_g280760.1 n/a (223) ;mRNA; f:7757-8425
MSSTKVTETQTTLPVHGDSSAPTSEERFHMPQLGRFKVCSILLGFLVGVFIYLSTLGAEFIAVMLWGKEILAKTNSELVFFSLSWNLATTIIALVILSTLRRLVASVFLSVVGRSRTSENAEDVLAELLSYLEGRFAVGALVGICISWNITNIVLGMRPQLMQSCIIMAVACLWCRVTLTLLGQTDHALIYDRSEEEEDEEQQKEIVFEDDKTEPLLWLRTV